MSRPRIVLLIAVLLLYGCQSIGAPQASSPLPSTATQTEAPRLSVTTMAEPTAPSPTTTASPSPRGSTATDAFTLPSNLRPLGRANLDDLNPIAELRFEPDGSDLFDVAASNDGVVFGVAGNGGQLAIWDLEAGRLLAAYDMMPGFAVPTAPGLRISPDGRFAVTRSGSPSAPTDLSLLDLASGGPPQRLEGLEGLVPAEWYFDPSGTRLTVLVDGLQPGDPGALSYDLAVPQPVRRLADQEAPTSWENASLSAGGASLAWLVPQGATILDLAGDSLSDLIQGSWQHVALSPDGGRIVLANASGEVAVFDVESGQETSRLVSQDGPIMKMAISPDGAFLATAHVAHEDGCYRACHSVVIWDLRSGREAGRFEDEVYQDEGPFVLSFSPDGKVLAVGYLLTWLNLKFGVTGSETYINLCGASWDPCDSKVSEIAFSADGAFLFGLLDDRAIRAWDLAGWVSYYWDQEVYLPRGARLPLLAQGRLMGTVSDGVVQLWGVSPGYAGYPETSSLGIIGPGSAEELQIVAQYRVSRPTDVTYSADGATIAVGHEDGQITLLDTAHSMRRRTLDGHSDWVYEIEFSPDGKWLSSVSKDGTLRIWDIGGGVELFVRSEGRGEMTSVAYSPDGGLIATASTDRQVVVRRAWDGVPLRIFDAFDTLPVDLDFSPDGRQLAALSQGNTLVLWNLENGAEVVRSESGWDPPLGNSRGYQLAFSPLGDWLALGTSRGLAILDASDKQMRVGFLPQRSSCHTSGDLAVSPHGAVVAAGGLHLCDPLTGEVSSVNTIGLDYGDIRGLAFRPDGRLIATVTTDGALRLWGVYR